MDGNLDLLLFPQRICRPVTRLVPKLSPQTICSQVRLLMQRTTALNSWLTLLKFTKDKLSNFSEMFDKVFKTVLKVYQIPDSKKIQPCMWLLREIYVSFLYWFSRYEDLSSFFTPHPVSAQILNSVKIFGTVVCSAFTVTAEHIYLHLTYTYTVRTDALNWKLWRAAYAPGDGQTSPAYSSQPVQYQYLTSCYPLIN